MRHGLVQEERETKTAKSRKWTSLTEISGPDVFLSDPIDHARCVL